MVEVVLAQFDPRAIAQSGQCFRLTETQEGVFRLVAEDRRLRLEVAGKGVFRFDCSAEELDAVWRPYFDLDADYARLSALIPSGDAFLTAAYRYGAGVRILRQRPWETLVTFLISQNNNIPRIRGAVERLSERFGARREDAEGAYFLFPTPERLAVASEDALAACSLGYRTAYVLRLARDAAEGRFDADALRALSDDALLEALTALYGVGPKVARCVMLFGYHRLDAFPVDTWMQKALSSRYPQGFPLERYEGCAGVMQQYIFFYERHLANHTGGEKAK